MNTGEKAIIEEVSDELGTKGLRVSFRVAATQGTLLDLLWDPRRLRDLFPDILGIDVIASSPDSVDLTYRVDGVFREVSYTLRRTIDRVRGEIAWRELGGDLRRVRGGWRVEPDGDVAARVIYSSFVDVGRFVPTALVRSVAMRKANEMVARVRDYVARARGTGG